MSAVTVTSENSAAFYAEKLGLPATEPAVAPAAEQAKTGEPAVESEAQPKAKTPEPGAADEQLQHPDPEKRQKLNLRFSELSRERDEAKARADKAEADAKAAREARELAERQALELRTKYEPPKPDELGPKPARQQFANDDEFAKALEDWAGEKAVREVQQRDAQQKMEREWSERQTAIKAELPDYDAVLAAGASLMISDEVRAAIFDSEVGPGIVYHLAQNPDFTRDLAKKSRGAALREIGKLEATKPWAKAQAVTKPVAAAPEISRAPAPITPLKTGPASAADIARVDSDGRYHGTFEQYKADRQAGRIK